MDCPHGEEVFFAGDTFTHIHPRKFANYFANYVANYFARAHIAHLPLLCAQK
jgi:hypothetical protein